LLHHNDEPEGVLETTAIKTDSNEIVQFTEDSSNNLLVNYAFKAKKT